jgi:hypothetical protein
MAAPRAPPPAYTAAPLAPSPRPSSRTGRTIAIVAAAVLVLSIAAAAAFILLRKDAPSDLSPEEAQKRVAASLDAAAAVMGGDDPESDLVKVDVSGAPPAGSAGLGDIGRMHLVMEWGRDGARQMTVDASNGPVTISFTMTCSKDRRAMEYAGEAYVSRPYVDGAPVDCTEPFTGEGEEAGVEEGVPPLDELDASGADITVHDDGSIHAELTQEGATVKMDIDAKGRLTSMTATEPGEGTFTMTYQYGARRALNLPSDAKLMPAEVQADESGDGGKRVFRVVSSPQEPPLSEMEVHVQDYSFGFGDGDSSDPADGAVRFPADVAGPQVQGNYTVQYHDADGDGKVSAGDSWDFTDAAAAAAGDDPFSFGPMQEVVLYDEAAKGDVNSSPLGAPGLGWLPLAGLALGLALLRRR